LPANPIRIYQIFYDEQSRKALDDGFIPLDNRDNPRPDWFEFWVIWRFLKAATLDNDAWYGFFSPKFLQKTGLSAAAVLDALGKLPDPFEVALFTSFPDQLAYYQNPFEHGENDHPGLMALSQTFLDLSGVPIDLRHFTTWLGNSVFSNYVVAKPRFWSRWLALGEALLNAAESTDAATASKFQQLTPHGDTRLPMKVFIQERLPSLLLSLEAYNTFVPPHILGFYNYEPQLRRFLVTCDRLKEQYCSTGNPQYIAAFKQLRHDYISRRAN
jgi:hypothetical protein